MNPDPALLKHILSFVPIDVGTAEITEKQRRNPPNQYIQSVVIGLLVTNHEIPQVKIVNGPLTHSIREPAAFGYATLL